MEREFNAFDNWLPKGKEAPGKRFNLSKKDLVLDNHIYGLDNE